MKTNDLSYIADELDGIELENIHWRLGQLDLNDVVVVFVDFGKLCLWVETGAFECNPTPKFQICENDHLTIQHTTFGGDYWHLEANFPVTEFTVLLDREPYCNALVFPIK